MAKSLKALRSEKANLEKRLETAQAKVDEINGLMNDVDSQIAEHEAGLYIKAAKAIAAENKEFADKIAEKMAAMA